MFKLLQQLEDYSILKNVNNSDINGFIISCPLYIIYIKDVFVFSPTYKENAKVEKRN